MITKVKPDFFHRMAWQVFYSPPFGKSSVNIIMCLTELFLEMDCNE